MNIDEIVAQSRASQNKIELAKVLKYVGEIQPKVIVEIGTWRGYSMEVWKKAFEPEILIGLEKTESEIDPELRDKFNFIIGDSQQTETQFKVLGELKGRQIDFLFIDGDHNYEAVKRDYTLYAPLVRKGGIIAFHDTALNSNEYRMAGVDVQRFWNQLVGKPSSKYFQFWDDVGNGTGCGIYYVQ